MLSTDRLKSNGPVERVRIWYGVLILIIGVFGVRIFYVQIVRYEHYKEAALHDQLKQYEISASRGIIEAHLGNSVIPVVLNQKLYTLFADPVYIKNPLQVATSVAKIVGGSPSDYLTGLTAANTRYSVLSHKLTETQNSEISTLHYPGLGTQGQDYRTYPQGSLASQLLGFVDDNSQGQYGLEQALNKQLSGTPGQLKAITDLSGVPLAANANNILIQPNPGSNVVLTLDLSMQQQLESILKNGATNSKAESDSAIIMDIHSGAIKAMANFPTYDPSQYYKVTDPSVFQNAAVSHSIEVGSTMKTLTASAALNQGVIQPNTTFYDPGHWLIDGFNITDIAQDGGPAVRSIGDILNLSLNTGATWMLMQMGGGQVNTQARNTWYDYMVNHFQLGKPTGIEQGYEDPGYIPPPTDNGAGIDLTYANTAFGQAMTATPLQMGAALSSVLNGGTYYKPHLIDQIISANGQVKTFQPVIIKRNVVSPQVAPQLASLMEYVIKGHLASGYGDLNFGPQYSVGGKTGTAQVSQPNGGYSSTIFNGTYMGFVGGDQPQYVIVVFVYRPNTTYYAGTAAAQPIFADIAHMLINDSDVTPRSH